jgi:predicted DNA-binding transcriptional regulator AlpA
MSETTETPKLESRAIVAHRLGVSESSIKRLVKSGRLPRPLKVTSQRVGWKSADIDAFIASLAAA